MVKGGGGGALLKRGGRSDDIGTRAINTITLFAQRWGFETDDGTSFASSKQDGSDESRQEDSRDEVERGRAEGDGGGCPSLQPVGSSAELIETRLAMGQEKDIFSPVNQLKFEYLKFGQNLPNCLENQTHLYKSRRIFWAISSWSVKLAKPLAKEAPAVLGFLANRLAGKPPLRGIMERDLRPSASISASAHLPLGRRLRIRHDAPRPARPDGDAGGLARPALGSLGLFSEGSLA
ncbi:hypothetical protein C7M84_006640 [Penaeus vannamei]|uniref:Uncharacterized protein n=1 Tax=Penaeus vannamei TaxID=6689 RepID=A0A423TEE1_PENVA|nr:hypothetical protein C7M84_006640 [Penaeus vannamei]